MKGQGKQNNQRLKCYLVYKYLMENSDENHCVSAEEIAAYLIETMGIMAERRSIYKDIDEINKVLYALRHGLAIDEVEQDIEENEDEDWRAVVYDGSKSKKGYYVKYRFYDIEEEYDLNDIRTIAACLYSAKFITEAKAKEYVNIITKTLVSAEQAKEIKYDALLVDRGKTTNRKVFESVQTIYAAMRIATGKEKHTPEKISFKYVSATLKGDTIERRHGERYVVSPFKIIINDGNYYLIAFDDKKAAARTFRVDRMKEIKLTGTPRDGEEVFRSIDWNTYAKQQFGMYSGKKERVTLRFINMLLDTVIDKFGRENLYYQKIDDNHFSVQVEVAVTDQFFGWLCGFGKRVKIISPPPVQEKFVKFLDNIKNNY